MYQASQLAHADAMRILETVRAELERLGAGAAVAVCDSHGELLAFLRTDGCRLPSIDNAINKAYTAAREQRSSGEVGAAVRRDHAAMTNFGSLRYTSWGGGEPVVVGEELVGAVGVSGLPEDEDVRLARLGAAAVG